MGPGIQGMAFQARLHPDRAHGLPKLLLGIASDLLRHFVSQSVFSLIVDRNVRQSRCSFLLSRMLEAGTLCHAPSHQGTDLCSRYVQAFYAENTRRSRPLSHSKETYSRIPGAVDNEWTTRASQQRLAPFPCCLVP